ncbi:hypothetical protein P43SY_009693 [Pythium insidiosum]|uniref:CHY-type domain-containing protein n=1 Tax=Pythium insidiosum TaxID=114742 RepID=A0AAD5Q6M0_PYTIN|nr:hypothetical protein P43SY_009693 [Pythium insidiosum]
MCQHIANVQAPCCKRWFDCGECHFELSDHALVAAPELVFLCKRCRQPFRKDLVAFGVEDERCRQPFRKDLVAFGVEDEVCPHCENPLVVPVELPGSSSKEQGDHLTLQEAR